jgi:hypothetical protein
MQRTNEATVKNPDLTDTETLTVKEEKRGEKTENMGDTGIAMRIKKAKRIGGGTGREIQATATMSGVQRVGTVIRETMDVHRNTMVTRRATSSVVKTGSMVNRDGTKAAPPSRAAQPYDR